jgi:serine protease Do
MSTDIALLKIEAQSLDFLIFGNSDSLRIGEWVMAVGNPFRLQSTVTAGIVSAKSRNINLLQNQGIESFIQTDAAVNPGNSGGALINTGGELIGVCTAILSETGKYEGFSFAIPANLVRKVVNDIKQYGTVQRGWLGIDIENVDNDIAEDLGLNEVNGVLISSVVKGGGASDAGLKTNDVIISVNNIKTGTTSEFMELMGQHKPGDKLNIVYIRNKEKFVSNPTLRNQLNTVDLIGIHDDVVFKQLGIEVRDLDTYEKAVFTSMGVMVVSVKNGSIIGNTKMEPAYIITEVNNKKISSVTSLLKQLEANKGKSIILEGFYTNFAGEYPYTFEMP